MESQANSCWHKLLTVTVDEAQRGLTLAERENAAAHGALRDWQARMLALEGHGDRSARDRALPEKSRIDREVERTDELLRQAREALALAIAQREYKP